MDMFFTDAMEIADRKLDSATGFLAVTGRIARTGLYTYAGHEVGKPHLDQVIVYRPESAVFDKKAMAGFAHKPLTNDHPPEQVTASNWKQYAVGQSGGQVARDGEFLVIPMMVADSKAIADVQAGKVELSPGYRCKLDFVDGQTPDGEPYQAVISEIDPNHIAFVARGRGGPECRIGDHYTPTHNTGASRTMADNLRTVMVDGISISTTDQGAEVIGKLQKQISDAQALVDRATGSADALRADHTKAIEAKDGEIAALKAKVPDAAMLDSLVAARSLVIASARKVLGDSFDVAGKSDADLRRAAVVKRLGDAAVTGKSDDYVLAAFETLTAVADAAPVNDPMRFRALAPVVTNDSATAWQAGINDLTSAWQNAGQKGN